MNKLELVVLFLMGVTAVLMVINMTLISLGIIAYTCVINWIITLSPIIIALLIEMYILIRMMMGKDD